MAELLALEGVTLVAPDGRKVFEDLTWRLEAGARAVFREGLGNGASALLRVCAGLVRPSSGRVLLEGVPLDSEGPTHPFVAAGRLGWVPTDGGLAANLTLLDNAALPLRFARNVPREEAAADATRWLERAGLVRALGHRPAVPADRDAWLASLARAATKGSTLWLVDRPAGGLDAGSRAAARAILEEVGRDPAVTLVLVGGEWLAGLGVPLRIEDGRIVEGGS
jgi:predicted ABC-type transport system involved in lysophospholipase L1 biosynthesis ATPase subunit